MLNRLRWVSLGGSNMIKQPGTFSGGLYPGSRTGAQRFVGQSAGITCLYMFGGYGCTSSCTDQSKYGYLNGFWRWNVNNATLSDWELLNLNYFEYSSGLRSIDSYNLPAIYSGIKGKYISEWVNLPSARAYANEWSRTDSEGFSLYYMFGGKGIPESGDAGELQDLWKFNTRFMGWKLLQAPEPPKGPFYANFHGMSPGVRTPGSNETVVYPGGRSFGMTWATRWEFFLFGGTGLVGDGGMGRCGDMWKFIDYSSPSGVGVAEWFFLGPESSQYGIDIAQRTDGCMDGDFDSRCHPGGVTGALTWVYPNRVDGLSDDHLYMYGGSRIGGLIQEMWIYSTNKGQWRRERPNEDFDEPLPRINSNTFLPADMVNYYNPNSQYNTDGYGMMFGGYDSDQDMRNDLWVYGAVFNQWDLLTEDIDATTSENNFKFDAYVSYPRRRMSAAGWLVGERRYMFGGEIAQGVFMNDFWRYDMDDQYLMQKFPDPRAGYYILATVLVIVGGFSCFLCCCYCCFLCLFLIFLRTFVCNETYLAVWLYKMAGKGLEKLGWEIYWDEGELYDSDEEERDGEDGEYESDQELLERRDRRGRDDDEDEAEEDHRSRDIQDDDNEGEGEQEVLSDSGSD